MFSEAYEDFIQTRKFTIKSLEHILECMKSCTKSAGISKIAGASGAVAGGILAGACVLLAPFTAGASLAGLVPSAILGGAGAVTSIGAEIGEIIDNKISFKNAKELLEKDSNIASNLQKQIERVNYAAAALGRQKGIIMTPDKIVKLCEKYLLKGPKLALQTLHVVTKLSIFLQAGKLKSILSALEGLKLAAKSGAIAFSIILVPLEIYNIVSNAIALHKGTLSEKAAIVEEQLKVLKENFKGFEGL